MDESLGITSGCHTGSELAVREGVLAVLVGEGAVVPLVRNSRRHHRLVDELAAVGAVLQDLLVYLRIALKFLLHLNQLLTRSKLVRSPIAINLSFLSLGRNQIYYSGQS